MRGASQTQASLSPAAESAECGGKTVSQKGACISDCCLFKLKKDEVGWGEAGVDKGGGLGEQC